MGNPKREPHRGSTQQQKTHGNWERHWADSLHIGVLVGFSVAQPLFDLLARHAEFFAARRAASIDIIIFLVSLSIALPALLAGVEYLVGWSCQRLRSWLHTLLVACLSAAIVLQTLNKLAEENAFSGILLIATSLALGGIGAFSYKRFTAARQFVTLLAPAVLIFPGLFVLASPVASLLFPATATRVTPLSIPSPPPIVIVVFDEFSLTSLLNDSYQVDPIRYPNFAKLAREATWFRNTTTVSSDTLVAVPAMLTGQYPRRFRLPIATDHPNNLFTLLEGTYAFNVHETRTQLCPERLCGSGILNRPPLVERLSSLLSDVSIVYLHLLLPSDWRHFLPSISQDWMNFATPATSRNPRKTDHTGVHNQAKLGQWLWQDIQLDRPLDRPQHTLDFIATLRPTAQPTLHFLHILLPHLPYLWLPSGKAYTVDHDLPGLATNAKRWSDDEWAALQAQQRALLQIGLVDTLLGKLLAQLKSNGLYERSLLVVTADHGVSFLPGDFRRIVTDTTFQDIMPVPLFIKAPGQHTGRISDRAVEITDIVPTIADVLGIDLPWSADGRSALDTSIPERPTHSIYSSCAGCSSSDAFAQRQEFRDISPAVKMAAQRQMRLFGSGTLSPRLFQLGPVPRLVGKRIDEIGVGIQSPIRTSLDFPQIFSEVDLQGFFLPAYITGSVFFSTSDASPVSLAVAINGTIQAVTQPSSVDLKGGRGRWSAVVSESSFRTGQNAVEVFTVSGATGQPILHRATGVHYLLSGSPIDQTEMLTSPDGSTIPIVPQALRGWVDAAHKVSDHATLLKGWAVDEKRALPAEQILIFLNGTLFHAGPTGVRRPTIAKSLGQPAFATSGFRFMLPAEPFIGSETPEVRVFALSGNTIASELRYIEGYPWRPSEQH